MRAGVAMLPLRVHTEHAKPGQSPTTPRTPVEPRAGPRLPRPVVPAPRQSRDARRRRPSAADADELGVGLCHELGCDAGADSAVTKVLADRLTCDAQQALRHCRSHSPSGHQPTAADLFPDGREPSVSQTVARLLLASENSEARAAMTLLVRPRAATVGIADESVRRLTEVVIASVANQQPADLQKQQRGL